MVAGRPADRVGVAVARQHGLGPGDGALRRPIGRLPGLRTYRATAIGQVAAGLGQHAAQRVGFAHEPVGDDFAAPSRECTADNAPAPWSAGACTSNPSLRAACTRPSRRAGTSWGVRILPRENWNCSVRWPTLPSSRTETRESKEIAENSNASGHHWPLKFSASTVPSKGVKPPKIAPDS
ncbi:hypothetical protein G6F31_016322 [Rhizopus arrhizus]|nr:hypothetical protein G6F31_016322 [Rhizopus arrhizus]